VVAFSISNYRAYNHHNITQSPCQTKKIKVAHSLENLPAKKDENALTISRKNDVNDVANYVFFRVSRRQITELPFIITS
jgi:hypothetical protein